MINLKNHYHYIEENIRGVEFFVKMHKYRIERFGSALESIFYPSFYEFQNSLNKISKSHSNYSLRSQYKCGKYKIDFAIIRKNIKIAIELDGFEFHDKTKQSFNYERKRGRYLVSKGFVLLRFTWDDITNNFLGVYCDIVKIIRGANK